MRALEAVDDQSFAGRVLEGVRPVLVLFTAPGCAPCELQARELPPLARDLADAVEIVRCSTEIGHQAASRYRVNQTPMMMLFRDGRPLASHVGLQPIPATRAWIHAALRRKSDRCDLADRHGAREERAMARIFLRSFCSSSTRWRAVKVAGVVAPVLLLVNHSDLLLKAPMSLAVLGHLALNFLVPYLVASYSTARAATEAAEAAVAVEQLRSGRTTGGPGDTHVGVIG